MWAEVNGTRLFCEQAGSGPEVVLIPGLGAGTHVWRAQVAALAPAMRVTVVDPRGHGASEKPPGPYSIRLFAEDYAALLPALGIERAVLVGSSMSSLAAVEVAAAHPERVRGLVLVGGFAALPPAGRERMAARAAAVEAEGMAAVADSVVATAFGATTHARQPALVGLFRALLLANEPAAYAAAARAVAEADIRARLGEVRCPTLLVLGAEEQVAPLSAALELKAGIPHAELRVLPGCGHLPFLERPSEFNALLLEWLGRVSA